MSVHFHPEKDIVYEIENCDTWTKKEIRASWYKASKLQQIVAKRRQTALEWEEDESSGLYIRGLEMFTKQGKERFQKVVKRCVGSVLDEQYKQWDNLREDHEKLALVSQETSRLCVGLALVRAEEDEMEAQRIYQGKKSKRSKKRRQRTSAPSKKLEEPIIVVDDDSTSVCSDLSSPQMDSFHSRDSLSTVDGNPSPSRAKLESIRRKVREISQVLNTIHS